MSDNCTLTIKRFEFNMFPVNCYLLSDETGEAVIIDAGCFYPEEQQALKQYIQTNRLTVKHVLNTHLHLDHIFGNAFLEREFGLKPEAHEADAFMLPKTAGYCRMFGFEINEEPAALGHLLNDGDRISFGNTTLHVIHIPGHSPGGVAFYCKEAGCLFSGDSLFCRSIGRTDLDGGSFEELRNSICNRLLVLPPETKVYPGHGESTTIGTEKMENPFFR